MNVKTFMSFLLAVSQPVMAFRRLNGSGSADDLAPILDSTESASSADNAASEVPDDRFVSVDFPGQIQCHGQQFFYAEEDSTLLQARIDENLKIWNRERSPIEEEDIKSRPEGDAAIRNIQVIELYGEGMKPSSGISREGKWFRWAVFSQDEKGEFLMQAVALVQQHGTKTRDIHVHSFVSRKALLNDGVTGAGRALIASLLGVARDDEVQTLIVFGTPRDPFIDEQFQKHGAVAAENAVLKTGQGKGLKGTLQWEILAECVGFVQSKILCGNHEFRDYAAMFWSLVPASQKVMQHCAHMVPPQLYLEGLGKLLGLA